MKFSYQWLSELVGNLDVDPVQLGRLITMKTAECEGVEAFAAHLSRVIAVQVTSVETIDGGKNRLVRIDAGEGRIHQVVCGAPNVRVGMLAAWVPPGTNLSGKAIGAAVIDSTESEGMLASAAELELGRDNAGLLELTGIAPGQPISGVSPDWIVEIDNKSLTHRPDLWGHYGMAREVAAICGRTLIDPVPAFPAAEGSSPIRIKIENGKLCPRYSALLVEGVTIADSPLPMAARLGGVGLNPISNIVDITNYVLAELPQPMHAFDADKLSGDTIFIRSARAGESLKALNGETYKLHPDDLVIADAAGPIAIAGVIGGADSAITASTTRVVLESANFQATNVRLTSARHKLRTDASVRFEKSLDPENTVRGLARAYGLIRQFCTSARMAGGIADSYLPSNPAPTIALPAGYVSRKLGKEIPDDEIESILRALGFGITRTNAETLTVSVPSWRATKDISLKADLVEEIGRMIGYDEIPPQAPLVASIVPPQNQWLKFLRNVRREMAGQGFTEIYSYSFVSEKEAQRFGYNAGEMLAVANPIAADASHMRPSLLPGLFQSILINLRNYREFRIFEIGSEIRKATNGTLPNEVPHLAAAFYSAHADEQDFFELKRVLECILPDVRVTAVEALSYEHPARTASVIWRNAPVGRLFELHPGILEEEGVEGRAVLFHIDLQAVLSLRDLQSAKYVAPRRYPTSGFDLSVLTHLRLPVAEIQEHLTSLAGADLADLEFVRQYDGPPLPQGRKSVTYHLEIGSFDRTVTTEEVTAVRNRIVEGMRALGFEFRS